MRQHRLRSGYRLVADARPKLKGVDRISLSLKSAFHGLRSSFNFSVQRTSRDEFIRVAKVLSFGFPFEKILSTLFSRCSVVAMYRAIYFQSSRGWVSL